MQDQQRQPLRPVAVVVCGPSGVGKSSVGARLAEQLSCAFVEGDDYHSAASVQKMRAGVPLTDDDRLPWLLRLRHDVVEAYVQQRRCSVVLACSALTRRYRDVLRGAATTSVKASATSDTRTTTAAVLPVCFVQLHCNPASVASRLAQRRGHFMPPSLLSSQLATLEQVDVAAEHDGVVVDAARPLEVVVADIARHVRDTYTAATAPEASRL